MSSVSGAHRDSWIEGLEGTRGVMVLSIDSVTDAIVIGSVSGGLMGEGPGQGWCNTSYFNRDVL